MSENSYEPENTDHEQEFVTSYLSNILEADSPAHKSIYMVFRRAVDFQSWETDSITVVLKLPTKYKGKLVTRVKYFAPKSTLLA